MGKIFACAGAFLAGLLLSGAAANTDGRFSHKSHALLKLPCVTCHSGSATQDRAGFPSLTHCKTCHSKLAEHLIPSQRVYRVPDFVFFSHAVHSDAKVPCSDCHGDVYARQTLESRPATMKACVDCHKERKATTACNACHELGR